MTVAICCGVDVPVSMCVCVSPDCSRLTLESLRHMDRLLSMKFLALQEVQDGLVRGQGGSEGWIQGLPESLEVLVISGELQRHSTLSISALCNES